MCIKQKIISLFFVAFLLVLAFSATSFAVGITPWEEDGVEICTADNDQYDPQIVSDGAGGAIITWQGRRNSAYYDIYAQRVDSSGVVQWTTDGVVIRKGSNFGTYRYAWEPQIVSDGAGGAIITWEDRRNGSSYYDIYAQRISSSGIVQWTTDGVVIRNASNFGTYLYAYDPQIISDGTGGAIITWEDQRNGSSYYDIYAQRISGSGIVQWTTDGVVIRNASNFGTYKYARNPQIASDGNGGAIITWNDYRSSNYRIYAQQINSSGIVQWTTDGVVICSDDPPSGRYSPHIVSDGAGGAIITWDDSRGGWGGTGTETDIYAQKVNSEGIVQWTTDGVAICTAFETQYQWYSKLVTDGDEGAIITWMDFRNIIGDIYAQRIDKNGNVRWTTNGLEISTATLSQVTPQIISDGNGGAIITWRDIRDGFYDDYLAYRYGYNWWYTTNWDIYAQKVNAEGIVQWTTDGLAVCTAGPAGNQQYIPQIASDGAGGAIIVWQDERNGYYYYGWGGYYGSDNSDIYAQRVADILPSPPTVAAVETPTSSLGQHITGTADAYTTDILVNGVSGLATLDANTRTWSYDAQFSGEGTFAFNFVSVFTLGDQEDQSDPTTVAITVAAATLGIPTPVGQEELGEASVSIPLGVVSDQHAYPNVESKAVSTISTSNLPAGTQLVSASYGLDITITDEAGASVTALDQPLTITIPFSSIGSEWQTYHPYWYNESYNAWGRIPDENIVEKTSDHITFTISHLTIFVIIQAADTTNPTISNLQFDSIAFESGDFSALRPVITASLADTGGAGIDTSSIQVQIDGSTVSHSYTSIDVDNGTVSYQPSTDLTIGLHALAIDVSDTIGNAADTLSANFEVETTLKGKDALSFPSPVDPTQEPVKISYNLSIDAPITVEIYDVNHKLVWRTAISQGSTGGKRGYNEVAWNGIALAGNLVPNDVYYFYVISSGQVLTKGKIVVLK